uniref:Uncharacterized protein n=1 Tax=Rhizophora mucronata TaxID=61149 RepID=A0A2P2PAV0_RHIMU
MNEALYSNTFQHQTHLQNCSCLFSLHISSGKYHRANFCMVSVICFAYVN